MNGRSVWTLLAAAALLAGCLEEEQYPAWRDGAYDGKHDTPPAQARFQGDHLGWNAVLIDRNHLQNEYERTEPAQALQRNRGGGR